MRDCTRIALAVVAAVLLAAPAHAQKTGTGHLFHILPNGGTIELQLDNADGETIAHFREHLQEIARAFAAAEPPKDLVTHIQCMPGGAVMLAKRNALTVTYSELPRGGELRIATADAEALRAVHEFLTFQRGHHDGPPAHGQHSAHTQQRGCGGHGGA